MRRKIVDWIPFDASISWMDLLIQSKVRPEMFKRVIADLKALNVVEGFSDSSNDLDSLHTDYEDDDTEQIGLGHKSVRFTEEFRGLIKDSGFLLASETAIHQ